MSDEYQRTVQESRVLANRMRSGTGAATLLQAQNAPTHHIDALQRFQKDFAQHQKQRRESQKFKRQSQLQRKRIEILERQNNRWQVAQIYQQRLRQRQQLSSANQRLGVKKTANTNGLPYNPITLEYDRNPEGQKLRRLDQDIKIRGFVRAHNMETHGNSKYNIVNGQNRLGVQQIVPKQLNQRFQQKKFWHYDNLRLKIPSSAESGRMNPHSRYH